MRQEMSVGFEEVNRRFDRVENDIADIRQDVARVNVVVLEHTRELKEIRVALDRKVDRDEVEGIIQRVVARSR